MTKPEDETPSPSDLSNESVDSGVRDLLRSLDDEPAPDVDVLTGVQRKLRERSGGKFYADGWSTTKQPPVATYLVTGLVMLAVVVVSYLALSSLSGRATKIDTQPKPVQVLPP